jgi:ubiquinone biosynthesis protein
MKIAVDQIRRYKDIVRLLWKYGRSDLVRKLGADDYVDEKELKSVAGEAALPEQLADDLEAMGPTYVKLAQILSGRPDLLPEPYVKALARLQDKVKPFPFAEVEKIIQSELGVRISKAFSSFEQEPIAAASLGQVHAATLRDGRPVVVKVQRPDIRPQIAEDFEVLAQIAGFLDAHTETGRRHRFLTVLEEFRITIRHELDYVLEAQNMRLIGENLKEFELIQIPRPVQDYCTRCVLTMDYIQGTKITRLSPLARLDLKGEQLAEQLFQAYLKQVLVDGIFHADPHPGNVFLTDDGRVALLDLGMVGHTSPGMQENLLKLLLAIGELDSDEAADLVIRISQKGDDFDRAEFRHELDKTMSLTQERGLQQMNVARLLLEAGQSACQNGLFVPSELTLLGKTLLQLEEVGRILNPAFDPNGAIQRHAGEIVSRRIGKSGNWQGALNSMLEGKEFVKALPSRLNKIMDSIANAEFEVRVKATDAKMVVEGIQKIANRITAGIVLAALIVGAALLTQVPTSFRIFGYPGLAMLCFLAAMTGGFWLLLAIFFQDRKRDK